MYELSLYKEHLECISKALDLYISVGTGQLNTIINAFNWHGLDRNISQSWRMRLATAKNVFKETERLMFNGDIIGDTDKVTRARVIKDLIQEYNEKNIELNEHQAMLLVTVMDFYSRIALGQFEEILHGGMVFGWDNTLWRMEYEQVRQLLNEAKFELTSMPFNASLGIFGSDTPESAKVAYDIQQVVRHRLAWDAEPAGGVTINFDSPMQCSSVNLPIIKERK